MADKMVDRFSIPDGMASFRQKYDIPTMTGGQEPWNPEERTTVDTPYPHSRTESPKSSSTSNPNGFSKSPMFSSSCRSWTGGGEGGEDGFSEHPDSADPELLFLHKEYDADKSPDKKDFTGWLNDFGNVNLSKRKKIEAKYPNEDLVYNLTLNKEALKRKVEPEIAGDVQDFLGTWTHGQNEIKAIKFEVSGNENKISAVLMQLKDSVEPIRIPSFVFRSVFNGVSQYKNNKSEAVGFSFKSPSEKVEFIHPGTNQDRLQSIMSKLRINNVALSKNIEFSIGNHRKPPQI